MDEVQKARNDQLKAAAQMGANLLREIEGTSFVVCAVTTMRDAEGEPSFLLSALYTNLFWKDPRDGKMHPPTIGQLTDLILEARLRTPTSEINQTIQCMQGEIPRA